MTRIVLILWLVPLAADGLIAGAAALKLFRWWRDSRNGGQRDRMTGILCLVSLGHTLGAFFWLWGITYINQPLPPGYAWRQLVARTCTAIPALMWAAFVFDLWGLRKQV